MASPRKSGRELTFGEIAMLVFGIGGFLAYVVAEFHRLPNGAVNEAFWYYLIRDAVKFFLGR